MRLSSMLSFELLDFYRVHNDSWHQSYQLCHIIHTLCNSSSAFDSAVIMRHLLQQSLLLSVFVAITLSVPSVRTNRSASDDQSNLDRSSYCGPQAFAWKERGSKLMEDCDILKDNMKIHVGELTDKTECISLHYAARADIWKKKLSRNVQLWKLISLPIFI